MTTQYILSKARRLQLICSFLLFIGQCASADIRLTLPEDADLLALNGTSVQSRTDLINNNTIILEDGLHQIVVNYTAVIDRISSGEEFETTDTFVILFKSVEQQLTLTVPKFKRITEIKRFNKNPDWKIIDKSGNPIEIKVSSLKKSGLQINRNYEQELNIFNAKNKAASLPSLSTLPAHVAQRKVTSSPEPAVTNPQVISKPIAKATPKVIEKPAVKPTPQVTAPAKVYGISSRTLIELYQQASPASQQEFINWLNQQ